MLISGIKNVCNCKSMVEMGTEPDPDSESKIWRLTGSGTGFKLPAKQESKV